MQKLNGWTKNPFVGCDKCKEEGRIVCQATRYRIKKVKGTSEWQTIYYCQYHQDKVDPPEKRMERKKKKELEQSRKSLSDDRERDWYHVIGGHHYM